MINLYLSENSLSLCRIIQPCLQVCFRTSKCHSQRFLGVELRELQKYNQRYRKLDFNG